MGGVTDGVLEFGRGTQDQKDVVGRDQCVHALTHAQ